MMQGVFTFRRAEFSKCEQIAENLISIPF